MDLIDQANRVEQECIKWVERNKSGSSRSSGLKYMLNGESG